MALYKLNFRFLLLFGGVTFVRQWKEPRSVFYCFTFKTRNWTNEQGKIKISYLLVEIFERPLNIPKRPSIENIGILHNYGPGVRGTNAQRLPSPIWEHSHLCQDFVIHFIHDYVIKLISLWFLRLYPFHGYFSAVTYECSIPLTVVDGSINEWLIINGAEIPALDLDYSVHS